ncbi:hypothetical protein FRC01_013392 [Tulasnella sp. 417]|nr:hypothetical protein FRC01_013392 [Tulasnella sp. 417]
MDSTSSSESTSPSFHPDMLLPSSRSQSQSRCSTPSKGILKARLMKRNGSSSSCCSKVHFAELIDEHQADDYDRCPCPIATPNFREIRELERIRRELVPSGRGITDQDVGPAQEPGEFTFSFDDGDDCDHNTSRLRPPPKRRLRGVPIELCPLLPADCPTPGSASPSPGPTPYNSNTSSPLNSPPHGSPALTPVDCPVPPNPHGRFAYRGRSQQRPGAMMSFLPILPAAAPLTATTPIPTPPETPTLLKLDLCADDALPRAAGQADLAQPTPIIPASSSANVLQEKTLLSSTQPTSSYLSTSPKNPPRCRMTILPCNSERQFAATPSSTLLSSSPPKSALGVCGTASNKFTPVNAPTTPAQSFTPFQMTFKATARTY